MGKRVFDSAYYETRTSLYALCSSMRLCDSKTDGITNFKTGDTLHGTGYYFGSKIEVTMPDGELLVGKYSSILNHSVSSGFGSATVVGEGDTSTAYGNSTTFTTSGPGACMLLKSTTPGSKLMMEFSGTFDSQTSHGFG